MKVEVDGEPFVVTANEFVKPGKGQPFNRVKIKNLKTGRVVEKTYRSGEKLTMADIEELTMRFLYQEGSDFVFMDEASFEQHTLSGKIIGDRNVWCKEDLEYNVVFYNGEVIDFVPPVFIEMLITETAPGLRGDTSGRVLKPAKTETGATIQVPIFVEDGERIKVDTRTGEYVSRV